MSNTEAMRAALYRAAIDCTHEIERERIVLHYDPKQEGPNALAQLADRLERAALAQAEQRQEVLTRIPDALRIALEDFDSMESLGPTTEKVIDAAQKWYLAAVHQPEEPKQHAPGLCLDSGEFIPAEELNKARNKE